MTGGWIAFLLLLAFIAGAASAMVLGSLYSRKMQKGMNGTPEKHGDFNFNKEEES